MGGDLTQGELDFWDYGGKTFFVERFDSIPEQNFNDIASYLVTYGGLTFKQIPGIGGYGIYSSEEDIPLMGIGPSKDNTKSRNIYLFPAHDPEIRENILRRGTN